VRGWFRRKERRAFTFGRSKREQVLARYVLGEVGRGRSLADVLDDSYVRNRSTAEERARLLERPEVVAAIGEQALSELRASVGGVPSAGPRPADEPVSG
jgi:hypothetical protein